ncbi:MAG: choice-of-anchor Q domain-containing protein [Candidatus Methylomirabilaceae bacterium]
MNESIGKLIQVAEREVGTRAKTPARSAALYRALLIALFALGGSACALDRQFTVNTTQDLHDLDPGDSICAANAAGNPCSLRAAFEETNQTIDSLRVGITVPADVYELTLGELALSRGRVNVLGAGQAQTVVDGLGDSRILTIETGGVFPGDARQVIFENLTLRNGSVPNAFLGGAVYINSPNYLVTFTSVTIEDSVAGFLGGGIYATGSGVLNVINSRIQGNSSTDMGQACSSGGGNSGGGGIYAQGSTLNVIQSAIRDNCGSNGAGIRLVGGANHLILRSTVSGNRGPNTGAGVYMFDTSGRIEDSTIARNSVTELNPPAEGNAAGLHIIDSDLTILNSTIVENENSFDFGDNDGAGGLLVVNSSVSMRNTVLADNDVAGSVECFGPIDSEGGNFFGETNDDCDIAEQASDILDGGDPELGDLMNNGGLTETMRPEGPLVDSAESGCEPIDQRGLSFPAPLGVACDIGAVER